MNNESQTNLAADHHTVRNQLYEIGKSSKQASIDLNLATGEQRREGLIAAASSLTESKNQILAANIVDIAAAKDLTAPMRDRLLLSEKRVEALAQSVYDIAMLEDPLGVVDAAWTRPNGLSFERVRVPLGVIGIIFESRPNVAADAGSLALKAGNAVILRGGSESFNSTQAIVAAMRAGIQQAGLPVNAIQIIESTDRALVGEMLRLSEFIDVIIPRGGKGLIKRVQEEARIPVIAHLDGNCHCYIHGSAQPKIAEAVVLNSKLRRTSVCGATESLIFDSQSAETIMPNLITSLLAAGCEVRGDARVQKLGPSIIAATESDWSCEYLDAIISVAVVPDIDAAIAHINQYGSHHTDAIIATDESAIDKFMKGIDSAIVLSNASTQFADGGEFGFGGEIGISTGKLHARGPVGAAQLTSYKYLVRGSGQVRP